MTLFSWSKSASAAVFAFAVIAACSSDPLYPVSQQVDAVYAAQTVGGQPLPRAGWGFDGSYILVADTLRFSSSGKMTRTIVMQGRSNGDLAETFKGSGLWNYSIEGKRLTIAPVCPSGDCIGPVNGTIVTSRATLREVGNEESVYKRID